MNKYTEKDLREIARDALNLAEKYMIEKTPDLDGTAEWKVLIREFLREAEEMCQIQQLNS